jgi:hypothetical protein
VIYLSGAVKPHYATWIEGTARPWGVLTHARCHEAFEEWEDRGHGIGFLHQPRMGNREVPGVVWAADNGCFTDPYGFVLDRYRRWLDPRDRETCLFVTAPDFVGEWCWTLDRYDEVAETLRADGWRVALVAQDGLEIYLEQLEFRFWAGGIDALFVGGSTEWKLSSAAAEVVSEARRWGLWTHMGRCNSGRRVRIAHDMGCDSVDGTYLAHAGARCLPTVRGWLEALAQADLPLGFAA